MLSIVQLIVVIRLNPNHVLALASPRTPHRAHPHLLFTYCLHYLTSAHLALAA
jgi:hypothetical protein